MPLPPGQSVGKSIKELHKGPRYAANKAKFGKAKANKIAVAVAERVARGSSKRSKGRGR